MTDGRNLPFPLRFAGEAADPRFRALIAMRQGQTFTSARDHESARGEADALPQMIRSRLAER